MASANSTGFRTVDTFTISFIYNIKSNGPNIDNNCLKIVTFNCHGFKSAMHDIRNMCMKYDIIFLQETWLSKNDNALLKDDDDCAGVE